MSRFFRPVVSFGLAGGVLGFIIGLSYMQSTLAIEEEANHEGHYTHPNLALAFSIVETFGTTLMGGLLGVGIGKAVENSREALEMARRLGQNRGDIKVDNSVNNDNRTERTPFLP